MRNELGHVAALALLIACSAPRHPNPSGCTDDAGCSDGRICFALTCVECFRDEQCGCDELCQASTCVEADGDRCEDAGSVPCGGGCGSRESCDRQTQTCERACDANNQCVAHVEYCDLVDGVCRDANSRVCYADAFETGGNDTASAVLGCGVACTLPDGPTVASLCEADEDWFLLAPDPGDVVTIEATTGPFAIRVDLEVFAADGESLIATSAGPPSAAEVQFIAGNSGTYLLRAVGTGEGDTAYTLAMVREPGTACLDLFELDNGTNDTPATATPLGDPLPLGCVLEPGGPAGQRAVRCDVTSCTGDVDYVVTSLSTASEVAVEIGGFYVANLDLHVFGPFTGEMPNTDPQNLMGSSTSIFATDAVTVTSVAGQILVRVDNVAGTETDYWIRVVTTPQ